MDSILQTKKECYFTGQTKGLNCHHIFFGGNRSVSEKNGFKVWLSWDRHVANSPLDTPHNNIELDLALKRACQRKYEETHTREDFMKLIGRSYL